MLWALDVDLVIIREYKASGHAINIIWQNPAFFLIIVFILIKALPMTLPRVISYSKNHFLIYVSNKNARQVV
jgi:hypothetical protein